MDLPTALQDPIDSADWFLLVLSGDELFDAGEVRGGGNDPFDDLVDGPPCHPAAHSGGGAVHAGDAPHHEVFEVAGNSGAWAGEGDRLDTDSVVRACQTSESPAMARGWPHTLLSAMPDEHGGLGLRHVA